MHEIGWVGGGLLKDGLYNLPYYMLKTKKNGELLWFLFAS